MNRTRWSTWSFYALAPMTMLIIAVAGCQNDGGAVAAEGRVVEPTGAVRPEQRSDDRGGGRAVAFPTGRRDTSAIVMDVEAPEQVRVGQPFQYRLKLTNVSDAPLTNVRVSRVAERPNPDGDGSPAQQGRQTRNGPATAQAPANEARQASASGRPDGASSDDAARPTGPREWVVGTLMPGESKTIVADAAAEQVGQFDSCLAVTYQPAVCVTTRVVDPALRVTKQGPSDVLICEPLVYTYTVANVGTGIARNVTVREELPDGLVTEQGQRMVTLSAGDIPAGQTKQAQVRVKPQRTGSFTSRAVARSQSDEAQSRPLTTVVREPKLALEVGAPEWEYVGQTVTYRVTVRNTGDGPARDAKLAFDAPDWVGNIAGRDLGVLAPNEARSFSVTVPGRRVGPLKLAATAEAFCAERVTDTAATDIRGIVALRLELVDNRDPVRVGESTTYQIAVTNQGSADATNVRMTAQLPEGLTFTGATGTTEVTANGQELTFAPVQSLPPGAVATWWIEATARKGGPVQFKIQLDSESLERPVVEQEPTRLYE